MLGFSDALPPDSKKGKGWRYCAWGGLFEGRSVGYAVWPDARTCGTPPPQPNPGRLFFSVFFFVLSSSWAPCHLPMAHVRTADLALVLCAYRRMPASLFRASLISSIFLFYSLFLSWVVFFWCGALLYVWSEGGLYADLTLRSSPPGVWRD